MGLGATAQSAANKPGTAPNVLFILDASGSMWQKLDKEFRIVTAKTVMKNLAGKLPAGTRAGLIAYGHSRKDDCNDIETLVPLALLDKAAFAAKLEALNPMGKTPIAKSIMQALALIRSETAPITIILVSDGLETCEGDACDLVQKAKAQGVKITMHVVGFGMEEKDLSALECIAQAGGGQYFPANNADELTIALDQTVAPPPVGGGYLSVKVTSEGKLLDGSVNVFKKGEKKPFVGARTYEKTTTNPRLLLLPPGTYDVEVVAVRLDGKPTQMFKTLTIAAEDTLRKDVDFSQGTMKILVTRNGELSDATVTIFRAGTKERVAGGRSYKSAEHNPAVFRILPGQYDIELGSVEISDRPEMRFENKTLESGGIIEVAHDFKSGELKIGAQKDGALIDAGIQVISKKTNKSVAGGRTYVSSSSNPKTLIVEPGEYRIELSPVKPAGLAKKTFDVTLKAQETIERTGDW